jgi:hypothetical protein
VREDAWQLLANHVLVDELCEYLPVVDLYATDVFLVAEDGCQEVVRDNYDDNDEKDDQHSQLVLLLLQELGEGDADSHAASTVGVAVLEEIVSGFLVGHDGVCLGDRDELVDGFGVVWVLVGMLLSGQLAVGLLDGADWSVRFNSQDLVGDESLEWLDVLDCHETDEAPVPHHRQHHDFGGPALVEPGESVELLSLSNLLGACGALAILDLVVNPDLSLEDRLEHEKPGEGQQDDEEHRQAEVVEG